MFESVLNDPIGSSKPSLRIAILIAVALSIQTVKADWPQFRGPNSGGIADSHPLPEEFGPNKHERWSVPIASGHSSPIVIGDSIYLTTFQATSKTLSLVCIRCTSGEVRWQRDLQPDEIEHGHPSFNPASSSPAADNECVVAYFGSFGLICFDHDGTERWRRPMPVTKSFAGNATSPVIFDDRVILYRGNRVDHLLLAIDKATGETIWEVQMDEPFVDELACTACPIRHGEQVIIHAARSVQSFDLQTGQRLWQTKAATTATSTPVIAGDEVIVAAWNKMGEPALRPSFPTFEELVAHNDRNNDNLIGREELPKLWLFHRPDGAEAPMNGASIRFDNADHNSDGGISADEWDATLAGIEKFRAGYQTHGILAIPLDGNSTNRIDGVRTLVTEGVPEVPSPIVHDGIVYAVKNGGILTCIELASGNVTARIRTEGRGTHYASPVIGDNKLFTTSGDGTISVLTLERKPQVVAVNKMLESVYATPAIDNGVIYIRSHLRLYAFSQ